MKASTSDHLLRKAESKRQRLLEKSLEEKKAADRERHIQNALQDSNLKKKVVVGSNVGDGKLISLEKIAPRIFDFRLIHPEAFDTLAALEWIRPLNHWKPQGKSATSLFYSLAEHLLAKYPMPAFLWSGLWVPGQGPVLGPVVARVANGESIFNVVKSGTLPPLTRKMCHELMQTKGRVPFMDAIRTIQVKALGGSCWLAGVICNLHQGRTLHNPHNEEFYNNCFAWFASNPMLDTAQVAPMFDYIEAMKRENPLFSMKGRSPIAFMRSMADWHGQLVTDRAAKAVGDEKWSPTGFMHFRRQGKITLPGGAHADVVTNINEILTSKDLADEGKALHHCVFSYVHSAVTGRTSIWSMNRKYAGNFERMVTIEVDNKSRKIVQVRGSYNRRPSPQENEMLNVWASGANLVVAGYV